MKKYIPIKNKLLPENCELIEGTTEIFELDFALWEHESLSSEELIKRSAYFKTVDGIQSTHYQTCNLQNLEEVHKDSSLRTKAFFLSGKYSTGYATHNLFPYRGKFHPQMIRALLNVIGVNQDDVVLDPMSGSGTLSVEANLLGIDSIGVDLSPFCGLMGRVKTFSLSLDPKKLGKLAEKPAELLNRFKGDEVPEYFKKEQKDQDKPYYEVLLLAFLDTMGFARRSRGTVDSLFQRVLDRYVATISNFQKARKQLELQIGSSKIIEGDATELSLEDNSVDAVITSPPYSFAIDYVNNDSPQLEYLGYNTKPLKKKMIGLQGRGVNEKLEVYFKDMEKSLGEMKRVSKPGSRVVIIVGTNEIQTGGVNLESEIKKLAENQNLEFEFEMVKPIKGLRNTMSSESILFFKNIKS
jgi:hypothetical protein